MTRPKPTPEEVATARQIHGCFGDCNDQVCSKIYMAIAFALAESRVAALRAAADIAAHNEWIAKEIREEILALIGDDRE